MFDAGCQLELKGGLRRSSFQARVVGVPGDDRNAKVAGQLQEILRRGGTTAVRFVVHHVQDGRHVGVQEFLTQCVQDRWGW